MKSYYDVIVIGAGPAGLSCGITLALNGMSCLIIERKHKIGGKVCGDGLSSSCMHILETISVTVENLLGSGGRLIRRSISVYGSMIECRRLIKAQHHAEYAIGISRDIFDNLLAEKAVKTGCCIVYGHCVSQIDKKENCYVVDGTFSCRHIVYACGVNGGRNIGIRPKKNLPVGISARVRGRSKFLDDVFYFRFNEEYGKGYAWVFPVGNELWNIGVWTPDKQKNIKSMYERYEKTLFESFFEEHKYERRPKGALLGIGKRDNNPGNYIGDCNYLTDAVSGEGISYAIESGYRTACKICGNIPSELYELHPEEIFCEKTYLTDIPLNS